MTKDKKAIFQKRKEILLDAKEDLDLILAELKVLEVEVEQGKVKNSTN